MADVGSLYLWVFLDGWEIDRDDPVTIVKCQCAPDRGNSRAKFTAFRLCRRFGSVIAVSMVGPFLFPLFDAAGSQPQTTAAILGGGAGPSLSRILG